MNSYRVEASFLDSFVGEKVALYSVMIFKFTIIFLTNRIFEIESILKYRFLVISITRNKFSSELISEWTGTEKIG